MAPSLKQLPCELEEEILSRLPLRAIVRFRTVCKRWDSLFNDKSFHKNRSSLSPPQFILVTASKVYSTDIIGPNSIDPTIELCVLPSSYIPYDGFAAITTCDTLLLCTYNLNWIDKIAVWNPWLRQVTRIEHMDKQSLNVVGLGYDNSRPDKVYKMLVWYLDHHERIAVYDCASHAFKSIDPPDDDWPVSTDRVRQSCVPLNGNLYWVDYNRKTREDFIHSFDFSTENFKPLCLIPCQQSRSDNLLDSLLAVYEGDRFSLLKQRFKTRNIEIWVTKKRIGYNNGDDGEGVGEWIHFMTFSATNLPMINKVYGISYFIYNKTIFMCCGDDETEVACIYVAKEDLCKKIQIGSGIVNFCHCVYTPNLISLPSFT